MSWRWQQHRSDRRWTASCARLPSRKVAWSRRATCSTSSTMPNSRRPTPRPKPPSKKRKRPRPAHKRRSIATRSSRKAMPSRPRRSTIPVRTLLQAEERPRKRRAPTSRRHASISITPPSARRSAAIIGVSSISVGALVTENQTDALATIRQIDPINVDLVDSSANLLRISRRSGQRGAWDGEEEARHRP